MNLRILSFPLELHRRTHPHIVWLPEERGLVHFVTESIRFKQYYSGGRRRISAHRNSAGLKQLLVARMESSSPSGFQSLLAVSQPSSVGFLVLTIKYSCKGSLSALLGGWELLIECIPAVPVRLALTTLTANGGCLFP